MLVTLKDEKIYFFLVNHRDEMNTWTLVARLCVQLSIMLIQQLAPVDHFQQHAEAHAAPPQL